LSAQEPLVKNYLLRLLGRIYAVLREAAARIGLPAAAVARDAIARDTTASYTTVELARARGQSERHSAIAAYAAEMAGTEADLDPGFEAASIECLLQASPNLLP
jgi:hypothetical protein